MQQFYEAAAGYSENNDGKFPQVPDGQVAATAAVTLKQTGYLPSNARLTCPAGDPEQAVPAAIANYAYSLGFRDKEGQLWGLDRRPENDMLPILADAPMRQGREAFPGNHRHGQNVLFAGGHVRFCTSPNVGVNGDDIFCNAHGRVAAGLFPNDSALGRPDELP
jgi:prepilin-type processing-associated H-X9-DG protein